MEEGGEPVELGFTFGVDPQTLCGGEDCKIFVHIASDLEGQTEKYVHKLLPFFFLTE